MHDHRTPSADLTSDQHRGRRPRATGRRLAAAVLAVGITLVGAVTPAGAAPPSNDSVAGALPLAIGITATGDTSEATYSASEDKDCGVATVWYQFTATSDTFVTVSTAGSSFDTQLGFYLGPPEDLFLAFCNDDNDGASTSRISAQVEAGHTYYVSVGTCCLIPTDGGVGPGGQFALTLDEVEPVTDVNVTLSPPRVSATGVLRMSGTVSCDVPGRAFLIADAQQRIWRFLADGFGWNGGIFGPDPVPCDPTPRPWVISFPSRTGFQFGVVGRIDYHVQVGATNDAGFFVTTEASGSALFVRRG